jgi:RimJ/RimL family protein N-acetyltransferase
MENMPYVERAEQTLVEAIAVSAPAGPAVTSSDWRTTLPILAGGRVTLRELTVADAPSLFAMLTTEEVARFISPPPTTVSGFERFIEWTHQQREAGLYVCFGVVPEGMEVAVGLFQVRSIDSGFATAEWGFAIGSPFWGSGLFVEGARLVLDFAFNTIGAWRVEARSSVQNGRGNGALRKLGAMHEGVLRSAFFRNGRYYDQNLWSILESDWVELSGNLERLTDETTPRPRPAYPVNG